MKNPLAKNPSGRSIAVVSVQRAPENVSDLQRAEELTSAIRADLRAVMQVFWRIGRALHEMQDQQLYRALGFATFADYVLGQLACERAQAYKLIRVARYYFQEDAEALGLERAAALIPYAKLLKTDPGLLVRNNAQVGEKAIAEASKRDIVAAAAEVRRTQDKRRSRAEAARQKKRDEKAIHEGLRDSLKAAGLPKAISIRFDARNGEVLVRLPRKPLGMRFSG